MSVVMQTIRSPEQIAAFPQAMCQLIRRHSKHTIGIKTKPLERLLSKQPCEIRKFIRHCVGNGSLLYACLWDYRHFIWRGIEEGLTDYATELFEEVGVT